MTVKFDDVGYDELPLEAVDGLLAPAGDDKPEHAELELTPEMPSMGGLRKSKLTYP